MKKFAIIVLSLATINVCSPATGMKRPRILGIDHVFFYTTDQDGVNKLYGSRLGLASAAPMEPGESIRFTVGKQWVGFSSAPNPKAIDRMDHVAFATDDALALRQYLIAESLKVSDPRSLSDGSKSFFITDPEGHRVEFVERARAGTTTADPSAISRHMIHTGFIVHNREVEDGFYRDILGFHLYWHGGMHEGSTDWVAMQVPDGTDWLEYMLNVPEHPDLRVSGVLNHISLGIKDMKEAQATLESRGWKPHDGEHSQMGRDGKWQLNLFDPDLSRIELMEFKPAQKPCCAEFSGPHPSE